MRVVALALALLVCVTCCSLQACFGVPTLILPNSVLQPPLLQPFLEVLQQHLKAAGERLEHDNALQPIS